MHIQTHGEVAEIVYETDRTCLFTIKQENREKLLVSVSQQQKEQREKIVIGETLYLNCSLFARRSKRADGTEGMTRNIIVAHNIRTEDEEIEIGGQKADELLNALA